MTTSLPSADPHAGARRVDVVPQFEDPRYELFRQLGAWIAGHLRRWLGIESDRALLINVTQLVDGQRRDFDALARMLATKDSLRDGDRALLEQAIGQLNRTSQGLVNVHDRLRFYEAVVPQIRKAKQTLDERQKKADAAAAEERAVREQLVAAHPELSEDGKAHVLRTGELPATLVVEDPPQEELVCEPGMLRLLPDDVPPSP